MEVRGKMDASGRRVGVVVARWNELVTKELLEGALDTLRSYGAEPVVVHVTGTWEIPPAATALVESGGADAVVALGCILQGATTHARLLAADVSRSLMDLQVRTGKPVSWGILTPETQEQALERTGLKHGNKGREAASAAVEMISVLAQVKK